MIRGLARTIARSREPRLPSPFFGRMVRRIVGMGSLTGAGEIVYLTSKARYKKCGRIVLVLRGHHG